jgi:hypothetical protein
MQFYGNFLGHDPGIEFNSTGHRCKEIAEVNLQNYILFAGDNIGVGLGSPIEETYPYLVSKKLKIDYYNLCIFNGGLDALRYNLITWFTTIKQRPRAVVVSCEFLNSLIVSDQNYSYYEHCNLEDDSVKELLDAGNMTGFFNARHMFADRQINNLITTPIYQIVFKDKQPAFTHNIVNVTHSDDMFDHEKISDNLVNQIRKRMGTVRP